jgi:hypothetical protein
VTRRALAALVALSSASCSWELPAPDVRRDVPAVRDAPDAAAPDVPPRDVVVTPDRAPVDAADVPDVSDIAAPDVSDVSDVSDVRDVADVPDVVLPDGGCFPDATRSCYTGNPDRIGVGYCRGGRQSCAASGFWSTRCENEILPDCTNRRCGTDGCEGLCGDCPGGTSCDPTGTCVTTACGPTNFTVPCGGGRCPANSECSPTNRCVCAAGYEARVCGGDRCPAAGCSGFDWWCAPAPFCGGGAVLCPGMYLCPRWSLCDDATRSCYCRPGFTARRCDGTECTTCPGTAYECVPSR